MRWLDMLRLHIVVRRWMDIIGCASTLALGQICCSSSIRRSSAISSPGNKVVAPHVVFPSLLASLEIQRIFVWIVFNHDYPELYKCQFVIRSWSAMAELSVSHEGWCNEQNALLCLLWSLPRQVDCNPKLLPGGGFEITSAEGTLKSLLNRY